MMATGGWPKHVEMAMPQSAGAGSPAWLAGAGLPVTRKARVSNKALGVKSANTCQVPESLLKWDLGSDSSLKMRGLFCRE